MRRLCFGLVLVAVQLTAQGAAYEPPNLKGEVFAGYSLVNPRPGRDQDRASLHGWTFNVTSYQTFARWGVAADFSGNRGDGVRNQAYLFGGTYRSLQRKRFALTGRILAGGTRWEPKNADARFYAEQAAFTFGFGQAIDLKFSEQLALRVQPEFRFVRVKDRGGESQFASVRPFSIGVAYKFGKR